jgi:hypothetical protein
MRLQRLAFLATAHGIDEKADDMGRKKVGSSRERGKRKEFDRR